MSIARKVMEQPGRYSIQQLQQAMERGILPAYVAIPLIQEKTQMQKQFEQQQMMQQQPVKEMPPIAAQIMQEAQMAQAAPGVEGLPSNLPQEYAGGGIVAFGDGGEVERYQEGGGLSDFAEAFARQQQELGGSFSGYTEPARKRRWNPFTNSYDPLTPEQEAQLAAAESELKQTYGATPTGQATPASVMGRPDMMSDTRAMSGTPPRAGGPGAGAGGPGAAPAGGGVFGATAAPQFAPFGRQEQATRQEMAALKEQEDARRAVFEQKRKEVEGRVPGKALEGYEKELRDAAMEAGASKKQAQSMALVEAGLAMMGGTSQNAFENISKGALVGIGSYKSALKDIEKAQKEHRMALAGIEQARRAEAIGDRDRELKYLEKANEAEIESGRAMVNAIMKARGVDEERAIEIWKTQYGGAKTIEGANIQARATMGAAQARQKESGISPYQQQMLLFRARQEYPIEAARAELKQRQGLKTMPPVGKDEAFDAEARRLYNLRIAELAGMPVPGMEVAGPRTFPGFQTLSVK